MLRSLTGPIAAVALLAGGLAAPSPVSAAGQPGRFAMAPVEGGILRLDTVTGAVSHCTRAGDGTWACRSAEDDMRTLHVEIDRLIGENRKLQEEVARLKAAPPAPGTDPSRPGLSLSLPSEAEIDRALETMDRLMRKLKDRFKSGGDSPRPPGTPL